MTRTGAVDQRSERLALRMTIADSYRIAMRPRGGPGMLGHIGLLRNQRIALFPKQSNSSHDMHRGSGSKVLKSWLCA